MTCDEIKNCILLMDAGELEPEHKRLIRAHLEQCDDCKSFQHDTLQVMHRANTALPSGEPSQDVISAILNEAAGGQYKNEEKVLKFPSYATQLLAYAACFAVVVLGWFIMTQTNSVQDAGGINVAVNTSHDHVEAVSQLLVDLEANEDEVVAEVAQNREDQLDQLADELMRFQGFDSTISESDIFAAL